MGFMVRANGLVLDTTRKRLSGDCWKRGMERESGLEVLYGWDVIREKERKGRNGSEELFINWRHKKRH